MDHITGEGHGNHCSILAWRIPWTEEPGRLQSMGSQRVGHKLSTNTFTTYLTPFSLGLLKNRYEWGYLPSYFAPRSMQIPWTTVLSQLFCSSNWIFFFVLIHWKTYKLLLHNTYRNCSIRCERKNSHLLTIKHPACRATFHYILFLMAMQNLGLGAWSHLSQEAWLF